MLKRKMDFLHGMNCLQKHMCRPSIRQNPVHVFGKICRHMSHHTAGAGRLSCEHNKSCSLLLIEYSPKVTVHIPFRVLSTGSICQTMSSHRSTAERNEAGDKDIVPTDNGMNLRLSIENDYLSWMRNSYIMTLGGVSMLHFDLWSAGPVAGAAALVTSGMNLCAGTLGYMHNLRSLRQRNHISGFMCMMAQIWAIIHFAFWGMVLMVIFPEYRLIEAVEFDDKSNESESSS